MTPRSLGPDVSKRAYEQARRFTEVQLMKPAALAALHADMQDASELPKLRQHFDQHRHEFQSLGIDSLESYAALFQEHIHRIDLRVFTYTSSKSPYYQHWSMIGVDNGVVVLYNESQRQHWSMIRPASLTKYLESGQGWWVEVIFGEVVRVEKW